MWDSTRPARLPDPTQCPIGDCSFGATEPRPLDDVARHVRRVDDGAHEWAVRRYDWNYEYRQIE